MGKDGKTLLFAAVVCVVCSLLLAGSYSALKDRQDANKLVDFKGKVLQVVLLPAHFPGRCNQGQEGKEDSAHGTVGGAHETGDWPSSPVFSLR